jgi:hypothetical protein
VVQSSTSAAITTTAVIEAGVEARVDRGARRRRMR